MKIVFILPSIGKKKNERCIGTWKMEPLTIAVLKALTPAEIETEFYDDRIELIDFNVDADLIALTSETYSARRCYRIADRFRERGIKVVIGGYHAALMPDETLLHADAVVMGNAESIWAGIIEDHKNGRLKKLYVGKNDAFFVQPDRSIYKGKKCIPLTLVETGRGCVFSCDFCSISSFYKKTYHPRPVNEVVEDIKKSGKRFIYFVDDNIVSNPAYAIELFKAITPLKIYWSSQGSLTMANDPEMLYWMKKSGCQLILIGFESLDRDNIRQMNKEWLLKLGNVESLVGKIHKAGINIYATFLFGFDHDNPEVFQRTLDFAIRQKFYFAAFNHLLTFPGTPLYEQFIKDNLILEDLWWLSGEYHYGDLAFRPKMMTATEISNMCAKSRRDFYRIGSIVKRGLALLSRKPSLLIFLIFWIQNFNLRKEVDEKMRLPLGENLDELPK